VQVTILAIVSGLILLASLALQIVGIHRFLLDGCGHHPSSEVVGGEIFNSLQRNLERTIALWTLDFPAGGYIQSEEGEEEEEEVSQQEKKGRRREITILVGLE